MNKFIILPAYNEEKALPRLLESIQKAFDMDNFEIIVVDDGSADRTAEVVQQFKDKVPLVLLRHETNRGLGEALKTGFKYIIQAAAEEDVVIVMDADNSHPVALIGNLADRIEKGYDIAIASRYCPGGKQVGVKVGRRILSKGINWLLKILHPSKEVKDYTSGFRAYRASIIRHGFKIYGDQFIQTKGFTSVAEILIKLAAIGAKISELPLILRYDLKKGKSKIHFPNVVFEYIRLLFSLRA